MLPIRRLKGQPQLWPMSAEPPPWVWVLPATSGLCRMGASAPPPFLISSHPPPLLQAVSTSWQLSCDPFLPLMRIPSAPEPTLHQFPLPSVQWELPSQRPVLGFQPSTTVDLVPVFPHIYHSVLPPPFGKGWVEKRLPEYKVYVNNALTLDTTWPGPEDIGIFQRHEKPLLMTNQMAMSISRPTTASRNFRTLFVSPQRISGCPVAIKRVGSHKRIALAAAAMMAIESDSGPSPTSSSQPIRLLSLTPIRIPILSAPSSSNRRRWQGRLGPVLPAHIARVASLSAPGVTFLAGDWTEQPVTDKSLDMRKAPCAGTLVLHDDQKPEKKNEVEPLKISMEEDNAPKDKRPVASTPVPGSPWCVVWTGDDRVFFFNPTMQLSVWEKPGDLKGRGDLNRILEDPPHKRKKDSLSAEEGSNSSSGNDEDGEEHTAKTKRNKMEDPIEADEENNMGEEEKCAKTFPHRTILPLELRIAHFRDMLLERGVSAFSTWEKELHKIVFDPRYLLLTSEERKQIFDQFVKARMKEEYKEKKGKLQQAKEEFRKLLEESKITSRSTFKEFSEKYGRDQRFKQVQKKKDQEHFFNQFVNALKKRDKENRLRLRKMR
ncbi:transcription elongation regulator 1-like protein [Conger conger]|uniref:transcription elongation regulator 1-like protein n=1 Tax=Conger conger TaxID=82655 RepID=UPI002A59D9F2|nr:transcription elongation regulator 1-like protein [Conger conger]